MTESTDPYEAESFPDWRPIRTSDEDREQIAEGLSWLWANWRTVGDAAEIGRAREVVLTAGLAPDAVLVVDRVAQRWQRRDLPEEVDRTAPEPGYRRQVIEQLRWSCRSGMITPVQFQARKEQVLDADSKEGVYAAIAAVPRREVREFVPGPYEEDLAARHNAGEVLQDFFWPRSQRGPDVYDAPAFQRASEAIYAETGRAVLREQPHPANLLDSNPGRDQMQPLWHRLFGQVHPNAGDNRYVWSGDYYTWSLKRGSSQSRWLVGLPPDEFYPAYGHGLRQLKTIPYARGTEEAKDVFAFCVAANAGYLPDMAAIRKNLKVLQEGARCRSVLRMWKNDKRPFLVGTAEAPAAWLEAVRRQDEMLRATIKPIPAGTTPELEDRARLLGLPKPNPALLALYGMKPADPERDSGTDGRGRGGPGPGADPARNSSGVTRREVRGRAGGSGHQPPRGLGQDRDQGKGGRG